MSSLFLKVETPAFKSWLMVYLGKVLETKEHWFRKCIPKPAEAPGRCQAYTVDRMTGVESATPRVHDRAGRQ